MKLHSLIPILFLLSTNTYAMFCPNNFNVINIGDSIETVTAKCGAPESRKEIKSTTNESQEWNYFFSGGALQSQASTLSVNVSFANNKVSNIGVNGTSMISTGICGTTINVGDSIDKVRASCGKPLTINQSDTQEGLEFKAQPLINTEFHYGGSKPATLIFKNGRLIQTH